MLLLVICAIVAQANAAGKLESGRSSFVKDVVFAERYHNYTEVRWILHALQYFYPDTAYVYSIGQSTEGRDLLVIAIAGHSPDRHVLGRPEVKYVANIHGDEAVGRVLLLRLAGYLLRNIHLVGSIRLHLLISLNPDGFDVSKEGQCKTYPGNGRWNSKGVDLNRDFPDPFVEMPLANRQLESKAVIWWTHQLQFLLSISIHGGALVVNYPFDSIDPEEKAGYSKAPDDDVLRHLASVYARHHPDMSKSRGCPGIKKFREGITNGAAWYPIQGGMQDYSYVFGGAVELTVEVSCCKFPNRTLIKHHWDQNRASLINLLAQAEKGVRGFLHFRGEPMICLLKIDDREVPFYSTKRGEFWRILMPGSYWLEVRNTRRKIHARIRIQVGQYKASTYNISWHNHKDISVEHCVYVLKRQYCRYQRLSPSEPGTEQPAKLATTTLPSETTVLAVSPQPRLQSVTGPFRPWPSRRPVKDFTTARPKVDLGSTDRGKDSLIADNDTTALSGAKPTGGTATMALTAPTAIAVTDRAKSINADKNLQRELREHNESAGELLSTMSTISSSTALITEYSPLPTTSSFTKKPRQTTQESSRPYLSVRSTASKRHDSSVSASNQVSTKGAESYDMLFWMKIYFFTFVSIAVL